MNVSPKRGRPVGSRNILTAHQKRADILFNQLYNSITDDIQKSSPGERVLAAVTIAGIILTNTKQNN